MKLNLNRLLFTPTLLFSQLLISQAALADTPALQREALIALYTATSGSQWHNKSNWLDNATNECDWFGVSCDVSNNTITGLQLNANNLNGPLPASIVNLSNLNQINIEYNAVYSDSQIVNDFVNARSLSSYTNSQTLDANGVLFTSPTATSLQLNWDAVSFLDNEGGYRVYMAEQIDSETGSVVTDFVKLADDIVGKTNTTTTVNDLVSCRQYFFKVVSYTDVHEGNSYSIESDGVSGKTVGSIPGFDSSCDIYATPYDDIFTIVGSTTGETTVFIEVKESGGRDYTLTNTARLIDAGEGFDTFTLLPDIELDATVTGDIVNVTGQEDAVINSDITANTIIITANNTVVLGSGSINAIEQINATGNEGATLVGIPTSSWCLSNSSTTTVSAGNFTTVTPECSIGLAAEGLTNDYGTIELASTLNNGALSFEPIQVGPPSQEVIDHLLTADGMELPTEDGNTCTITDGQCIAEDGSVYVFEDGKLVKEETGGGSFGVLSLLFLMAFIRRLRGFQY